MTGIFYPLVSRLLHTKTGQHSLPPLYMTAGTPPRFTQLSRWSPAIDARNGEDGPPTNQVAHRTPFNPLLPQVNKDAWLQNPNEIFPNLQKEPCIHPLTEVNPLVYPHSRNVQLTPLHPLPMEYTFPPLSPYFIDQPWTYQTLMAAR